MREPGELPADPMPDDVSGRPRWLRLLIGDGRGPSDKPWEPWVSGLLAGAVVTGVGVALDRGEGLLEHAAAGGAVGLFLALSAEFSRRRRLAGKSSPTWLPVALVVGVLLVVVAVRDQGADEVDYAAICREAQAPVTSPEQLLAMRERILSAYSVGDGNHRPTAEELPMYRASALLASEAEMAAAPYRIPAELRSSLPPAPDVTKVRSKQRELADACR